MPWTARSVPAEVFAASFWVVGERGARARIPEDRGRHVEPRQGHHAIGALAGPSSRFLLIDPSPCTGLRRPALSSTTGTRPCPHSTQIPGREPEMRRRGHSLGERGVVLDAEMFGQAQGFGGMVQTDPGSLPRGSLPTAVEPDPLFLWGAVRYSAARHLSHGPSAAVVVTLPNFVGGAVIAGLLHREPSLMGAAHYLHGFGSRSACPTR